MNLRRVLVAFSLGFLLLSSTPVLAAEISEEQWKQTINYMAQTDPVGFKMKLASRFHLNDAQLDTVFASVDSPADAFMVVSFAERSGKPLEYVLERYRSENGKWEAIAKSLGIKGKDRPQ